MALKNFVEPGFQCSLVCQRHWDPRQIERAGARKPKPPTGRGQPRRRITTQFIAVRRRQWAAHHDAQHQRGACRADQHRSMEHEQDVRT